MVRIGLQSSRVPEKPDVMDKGIVAIIVVWLLHYE